MVIRLKKRSLVLQTVSAGTWVIFYLFYTLFISSESGLYQIFVASFCALYLGFILYQWRYQFAIIKDGLMQVNGPWGKTIHLSDIYQIKRFAADYILKTKNKEITIVPDSLDPKSVPVLVKELEKLDVEWV